MPHSSIYARVKVPNINNRLGASHPGINTRMSMPHIKLPADLAVIDLLQVKHLKK